MKTQFIRLVDVFVLGPFMFAMSQQKGEMSREDREFLAFIGIATIAYNMANYLVQLRQDREQEETDARSNPVQEGWPYSGGWTRG